MSSWRQNWPYLLAALALAVALHTYVKMGEQPRSRSLQADIQFVNAGPGVVITPSRRKVNVTVQGPADTIQEITPKDISATVDLKGLTPGSSYSLEIQCTSRVAPDVVTCTPTPSVVVVGIDVSESKPLPLTARLVGTPPLGFEYDPPHVSPQEATVSGVSRVVGRVEHLLVVVPMGQTDIDRSLPIKAVDRRGAPVPGVRIEPPYARVQATIRRQPIAKNLVVSPILSGRPETGYTLADLVVRPLMVKARGDARLARLTAVQTVPIPLDGLSETETRQVPLERIPGVQFIPETVTVTIEVRRTVSPPTPADQGGKQVG